MRFLSHQQQLEKGSWEHITLPKNEKAAAIAVLYSIIHGTLFWLGICAIHHTKPNQTYLQCTVEMHPEKATFRSYTFGPCLHCVLPKVRSFGTCTESFAVVTCPIECDQCVAKTQVSKISFHLSKKNHFSTH